MDENGEILLLHASKNNARPLVLPWFDDFAMDEGSLFWFQKCSSLWFSQSVKLEIRGKGQKIT